MEIRGGKKSHSVWQGWSYIQDFIRTRKTLSWNNINSLYTHSVQLISRRADLSLSLCGYTLQHRTLMQGLFQILDVKSSRFLPLKQSSLKQSSNLNSYRITYYCFRVYLWEQYLVVCRYSINSFCMNDLSCLCSNAQVQTSDRRGQKRAAGAEQGKGLSSFRGLTRNLEQMSPVKADLERKEDMNKSETSIKNCNLERNAWYRPGRKSRMS